MSAVLLIVPFFLATDPPGTGVYGAQTPAPPAPIRSWVSPQGVQPVGFDEPEDRQRGVAPAQFESDSSWPTRRSDGGMGSSPPAPQRPMFNTVATDTPPSPVSDYTPPDYAHDMARPDESAVPPAADSRYRSNDYRAPDFATYPSETPAATTNGGASNFPAPAASVSPPPLSTPHSATSPSSPVTLPDRYGLEQPPQPTSVTPPSNRPLQSIPNVTPTSVTPPGASPTSVTPVPVSPTPGTRPPATRYSLTEETPPPAKASPMPSQAPLSQGASSAIPATGNLEPQLPRNSYFLTLLALFGSVGLNMYLGWISWDTYNRYQDMVGDMRYVSPRRGGVREVVSESRVAEAGAY